MGILLVYDKTRLSGRVFSCKGFTLVELIVTLMILGILAAVAGPRFFGTSKFHEMGFSDSLVNSIRYAQKLAMATGCDTRVQLTSSAYSLFQRSTACATGDFSRAVSMPGGNEGAIAVPAGVAVSALDIYFDSVGRPRDLVSGNLLTSPVTVTVGTRSLTVEPETGYVHQ